ncbi:unnamed protein product [Soboliphyme baturini]|uniref:Dirigent protein n=1 Tax=Soboliphyme baturini TaxID=241478 RepID=A0A183IBV4_9BILA|nr:unnamed protein product [Soboliphyme baturini]
MCDDDVGAATGLSHMRTLSRITTRGVRTSLTTVSLSPTLVIRDSQVPTLCSKALPAGTRCLVGFPARVNRYCLSGTVRYETTETKVFFNRVYAYEQNSLRALYYLHLVSSNPV